MVVLCMARVEGYGAVVLVFWFAGGACSWNNFRPELEGMKGGKAPAGEMCHNDKMVPMMGSDAMAPRGAA